MLKLGGELFQFLLISLSGFAIVMWWKAAERQEKKEGIYSWMEDNETERQTENRSDQRGEWIL